MLLPLAGAVARLVMDLAENPRETQKEHEARVTEVRERNIHFRHRTGGENMRKNEKKRIVLSAFDH